MGNTKLKYFVIIINHSNIIKVYAQKQTCGVRPETFAYLRAKTTCPRGGEGVYIEKYSLEVNYIQYTIITSRDPP